LTTAAAVSSQEDSMARMRPEPGIFIVYRAGWRREIWWPEVGIGREETFT
jgi:hypothetical protein